MNESRLACRAFFALYLALFLACGLAQAQPAKEYEPSVGQEGKDVVWVPTPQALVDKMLDMAKVTPKDYVIDLGSGDGRTVIIAAKRGAKAQGIEYNPDMVELSKRNAAKEGVSDKATFAKADLFQSDFSQATVYVSVLGSLKRRERSLRALERAHGVLQQGIARELRLRRTPQLIFQYDETVDRALRMNELLDQVAPELAAQQVDTPPDDRQPEP